MGKYLATCRGTKILAGANVGIGADHTLFALKNGIVSFSEKRKGNFDGTTTRRKVASVK